MMEELHAWDVIQAPYRLVELEEIQQLEYDWSLLISLNGRKIQFNSIGFIFSYRKIKHFQKENLFSENKKAFVFTAKNSFYLKELKDISSGLLFDGDGIHTIFLTREWHINLVNTEGFDFEYIEG